MFCRGLNDYNVNDDWNSRGWDKRVINYNNLLVSSYCKISAEAILMIHFAGAISLLSPQTRIQQPRQSYFGSYAFIITLC